MYEVTKIDNETRQRETQVVDRLTGEFRKAWRGGNAWRCIRPTILFTYVVQRI